MHASPLPPSALRERAAYYERIGTRNMTPLWEVLGALVPPQPRSPAQAALWRYAELREQLSDASTVFNVGRHLDKVVKTPAGLKFASRECIYDTEMIPNSIIYPV